jgi:hypothetical protein
MGIDGASELYKMCGSRDPSGDGKSGEDRGRKITREYVFIIGRETRKGHAGLETEVKVLGFVMSDLLEQTHDELELVLGHRQG